MRVKFKKGKQREFLKQVILKIYCPSLRVLKQYGININYQTLKSYYAETRTLPLDLFENLCKLGGIDKKEIKFKMIEDNYGQVRGGKN